jgi:DNA-binding LacI/PurR family transcriptional regulator/anti-anti-sigma regulatory factor
MPISRTIGVIAEVFEGPFHTPLMQAIHHALQRAGARLIYVQGTPANVVESRLATSMVDGWLVVNATRGSTQLASLGKPVILISGSDGDLPIVVPDNRSGTIELMRHLLTLGHTQIAFVGYLANPDFRERHQIYQELLEANGTPADPRLTVDPGGYDILNAYQACARQLDGRVPFSAVFGANDWAAMGAIQALRERGQRIPHDVAVAGFDDIIATQYFEPPLSSVRQRPDEIGRVALHLLLDQLDRGVAPPAVTHVPTRLIIRESSRASAPGAAQPADPARYNAPDWRARLLHDLVRAALDPMPLDADAAPERLWPSAGVLVDALDAAVQGRAPDPVPEHVWREAGELAGEVAALNPVLDVLGRCGGQRLAQQGQASGEQLMSWLLSCQRIISASSSTRLVNQFELQRVAAIGENSLLRFFNQTGADPRSLDWVERTAITWATIGLWDQDDHAALTLASVYDRSAGARALNMRVAPERFPPSELQPEQLRDDPEHLIKLSRLTTSTREWGYIATCERFTGAGYDTLNSRNSYIATMLERDALLASLTERQGTLQAAYERERLLASTIRELGCPLIPLLPGVLLVPLVGALDEQRAAQIIERVLTGVGQESADQVLLDITGVPLVDTHVAAALIRTAQAANLLGARVTLVGVRPEIAQSIVSLNVDLGAIGTQPNLAAAIQRLMRR